MKVLDIMEIRVGELSNKHVISLLQEHHQNMLTLSPPESVHALDLSALEAPSITFFSLWFDNKLAGIGAIKALNNEHAEIKSMRTASTHLRQGVADKILAHIIEHAIEHSYTKLSLETGTLDAFLPAQKLYRKFGFTPCEPFAEYEKDPYSIFMSKTLRVTG